MGKEAKYTVRLEARDRKRLQAVIDDGGSSVSAKNRAWILLKADQSPDGPGWTDEQIAAFARVHVSTVHHVRQCFAEQGLAAAVPRKPAEGRQYRRLNEEQEAHLIALACSPPPEGHGHWTYRLLADRLVALGVIDAISHECVRTTLKKKSVTLT